MRSSDNKIAPEFQIGQMVTLKSDPSVVGVITKILKGEHETRYEVFHGNSKNIYYVSQIIPSQPVEEEIKPIPLRIFNARLTAIQINQPGISSLYSLHSARINFIPFQFRPALKLIHSDYPRLLIADEVGVGKTIEAGLILRELQARRDIASVLVLCPKPLVADRKWQLELKRFDEDFTQLDGPTLRYCINEMHLDGRWPSQHSKTIMPFSLFNEALLTGEDKGRKKQKGLLELDPPVHFDLVIIDEAHHLRNTDTYVHHVARYFCGNAEASKVVFDLKKDKLIVTHDGKRLFNNMDVESITSIGVSTKKDDVNQIGKFGIGFKAVFAYTTTPRIYSGSFSFEIRDLVCPHPLETKQEKRKETLFEFPFNHLKKHRAVAFKETARGLENLRENVLLFLNNIETIEWDIEGKGKGYVKRLAYSNKHFEIEQRNIAGKTAKSHWLRFIKQIDPNSKIKNVAVAFKLGLCENMNGKRRSLFDNKVSISKQLQIDPIDGQLSVFFPAEKETTKLKFHIHGPFASTVAPDSIPPLNSDNKRLIQNVGSLLAESLHKMKEMGLLTVNSLAALPNNKDDLAEFYKPLQAAVIKEMKANPLVPTHMKGYASVTQLYQGPAAIRDVISDADLQFLLKKKSIIQWAAGVMQNTRQEDFLKTLEINEWSWGNLISAIIDKFRWGNNKNYQWLAAKSDDWMQRFYILLKKAMDATDKSLSYCKIVRLQSGKHDSGDNAFFPSEENKKNKQDNSFQRVKSELLQGKRKHGVRQFLEVIGVKEVGKQEELKYILDTYYSDNGETKEVGWENVLSNM